MPTTELHTHPKCNTLLNNIESPLTEKLPGNTNILLRHPYQLAKNKESHEKVNTGGLLEWVNILTGSQRHLVACS